MFDMIRKAIWTICISVLAATAAMAVTFTGPGITMVDGVGRDPASCSQVVVAGITGNVTVQSVAYNGFTHNFIGDLQLALYTPAVLPPANAGSRVLASPPDARPCNFANANILFIDTAAASIDAASAGCADATNLPSGSYRTSAYGGGTANGTVNSLATTPGVLTPARRMERGMCVRMTSRALAAILPAAPLLRLLSPSWVRLLPVWT